MKRVFDILMATIGLILLSPLFLLVAALIKLDSPGPIFFRQERIGKTFRPFFIYKFRTMVENAEEEYLRRVLPDKINLSKEYIRRSSFFFDLTLILKTVRKLFEHQVSS